VNHRHIHQLLQSLQSGQLSVDDVIERLRLMPYEDIDFARIDHHRALRTGFPEVVYGRGKTPTQVAAIVQRLVAVNDVVLCTRASRHAFETVVQLVPHAWYHDGAEMIVVRSADHDMPEPLPGIVIVSAGTSDLRVMEEAAITAEAMGHQAHRLQDCGVAGLHRVLDCLPTLQKANAIIAIAGMDGALPGVVAGLVSCPVIAVPTSVGYGASFEGITPLLTMLNSCALGLAVVNIDNGVGAGVLAAMINRQSHHASDRPVSADRSVTEAT
jgi:pyridinium-3,5-biscarboxylic acid mononucleotide synthase